MKLIKSAVALALVALVAGMSPKGALARDEAKTVSQALGAFRAVSGLTKKGVPPSLFRQVQGIAIFPGLSKLDFMVSGRAGSGILLVRDGAGNWSSPVFLSIDGGTLGWQIVGEPLDGLLLFKERSTVDAVLKDRFTMSGQNVPIPGPLGATLKTASAEELKAGINSYLFFRGAAEDFTLATAAVQLSGAANDAYYGAKKVRAADIISGKLKKPSAEVAALQKLLADFAAKKE